MGKKRKKLVGLVGLGTMGSALAEAFVRADYEVYAVDPAVTGKHFSLKGLIVNPNLLTMIKAMVRPRRIFLMVTAGQPVDSAIDELVPLLDTGDVIIDGGNSNFTDTMRRATRVKELGLMYVGTGISGGEAGARNGAAVMAGGTAEAFDQSRDVLETVAAKHGEGLCCAHVGSDGAGHFVKMVHNGIEYGIMQAIGEAHFIINHGLRLTHAESATVFRSWNKGQLESFLISVTASILDRKDENSGDPLIDFLDDAAEQTGTGQWMVGAAMELGVPVPTIAEAVSARSLSGGNDVRRVIQNGTPRHLKEITFSIDGIRDALIATILCCYAQGFAVLAAGATEYGWPRKEAEIARIWQKGCIIRADILETVRQAFMQRADLPHLFANKSIASIVDHKTKNWRSTVSTAIAAGIPVPTLASAISYAEALKTKRLWTALTQAQRDAFGAHGYRRIDRDGTFHSDWS